MITLSPNSLCTPCVTHEMVKLNYMTAAPLIKNLYEVTNVKNPFPTSILPLPHCLHDFPQKKSFHNKLSTLEKRELQGDTKKVIKKT